jgi:hypothetical protein
MTPTFSYRSLSSSALPGRAETTIRQRGWPTMKVNPLDGAERKRLIRDYLAQYAKSLSPARIGLNRVVTLGSRW